MKWTQVKKSLAQEVRQKSDILERRSKEPLLCLQHVQLRHCATCQGSSHSKNEYSLFYQKFEVEYFLFNNFFEKNCIFRENRKNCFGGTFDNFLGKEGVLRRKLANFFYHK